MKVAIAGDHYTVDLIEEVTSILEDKGFDIVNLGTTRPEVKISLQEIIPAVAHQVQSEKVDFGILACGTGVGVEIGANRLKGIRASLCRDAEQAKNSRIYDNANLLCLGSWYEDDFEAILNSWIENKFDEDEKRTQMLKDFDSLV